MAKKKTHGTPKTPSRPEPAEAATKKSNSKAAAKPKAAAAQPGHAFEASVRSIVRGSRTPLTLDQIHAAHATRFAAAPSRASVDNAVVSLLKRNELTRIFHPTCRD
jgi:hypothetical protein